MAEAGEIKCASFTAAGNAPCLANAAEALMRPTDEQLPVDIAAKTTSRDVVAVEPSANGNQFVVEHTSEIIDPRRGLGHVSCKYTKAEIMAKHWGLTVEQMGRVKALLRMGVCEEDIAVADRLLKMGR